MKLQDHKVSELGKPNFWETSRLLENGSKEHKKAQFIHTAQKKKFFIKDFFSKCDQFRSFVRI